MSRMNTEPREEATRQRLHRVAGGIMRLWSESGAGTHFGEDTGAELQRDLRVSRQSARELRELIASLIRWIEHAPLEPMPRSPAVALADALHEARTDRDFRPFMVTVRRWEREAKTKKRARPRR